MLTKENVIKSAVFPSLDKEAYRHIILKNRETTLQEFSAISSFLENKGIYFLKNMGNLDFIHLIISHLKSLDDAEFLDYPYFHIWLNRIKRLIKKDDIHSVSEQASLIVLVFVCLLKNLEISLSDESILLRGEHIIYPYQSKYCIGIPSGRNLKLKLNSNTLFFIVNGRTIAKIPFSWLIKNKINNGNRFKCDSSIKIERRIFLEKYDIELAPYSIFPEFQIPDNSKTEFYDVSFTNIRNEIKSSLRFLERIWPEATFDFSSFCQIILAYHTNPGCWHSGTTPDVPFTEALSFNPLADFFLTAEGIVHETSHIKLELLNKIYPLINDNGEKIYTHAWRDEKRPITSLLVASHAFLSICQLYNFASITYPESWYSKYSNVNLKNIAKCILDLDKSAKFTSYGEIFFEEMIRIFDGLSAITSKKTTIKKATPLGEGEILNIPFKHGRIVCGQESVTDLENIAQYLIDFNSWKLVKTDFYEQYETQLSRKIFIDGKNQLINNEFLKKILSTFENIYESEFYPFLKICAHKLSKGQYINIHNDNPKEFSETHRLIFQINKHWKDEFGGLLVFYNSYNSKDVNMKFSPQFGQIISFECANVSYHSVTEIKQSDRYTLIVGAWKKNSYISPEYEAAIREEECLSLIDV